jgi:hypothetical protein
MKEQRGNKTRQNKTKQNKTQDKANITVTKGQGQGQVQGRTIVTVLRLVFRERRRGQESLA